MTHIIDNSRVRILIRPREGHTRGEFHRSTTSNLNLDALDVQLDATVGVLDMVDVGFVEGAGASRVICQSSTVYYDISKAYNSSDRRRY